MRVFDPPAHWGNHSSWQNQQLFSCTAWRRVFQQNGSGRCEAVRAWNTIVRRGPAVCRTCVKSLAANRALRSG